MTNPDIVSSPHDHDRSSVSGFMFRVCLALLPGILCYVWFFGIGVLIQCLLSVCFALFVEALLLRARKRNLSVFLWDGSTVVTALLFALMITPFTPWWVSLIGISFGLVFAKHLYGGLGHNLFNPAATGYIFVLLCFPVIMNQWPPADGLFSDAAKPAVAAGIIFQGGTTSAATADGVDAVSGATPLTTMQNRLASMDMISEIRTDPVFGRFGGKAWEWINLAFLLGGIALIASGITGWQIPVSVLGSMLVLAAFFNMYDAEIYASPLFHMSVGGTMLGAFFIATDPVTASTTPAGRIIYGCLIGVLAYVIRTWGAYPDGIAFAVLIANAFVPLIDKYTRPSVLGES